MSQSDKNKRSPENIPGKYYVDLRCIGCDICLEIAPDHFGFNPDEGYEYVKKQPITDMEKERCVEAMEICPVDAIRDDGGLE